MKNHVYRKLCVGLMMFASTAFHTVESDIPQKLPVIHIESTYESRLELGLNVGHKTKALFPDIEMRYDAHLARLFSHSEFENIIKNTLPKLLDTIDQDYKEEINGVAGAWFLTSKNILGDGKLSFDEYFVLNLLADIGLSPNGSGFAVFEQAASGASPIIGRNLDWRKSEELRRLQTITVYHFGDKSIVNIGFAGMLSVLSGFNSDGLFVAAMNAAPFSPYQKQPQNLKSPSSSGFDLRTVLENHSVVKQASQFLSSRHYNFDLNFLLADKTTVKALEYPVTASAKVRSWNSPTHRTQRWKHKHQLAMVNCFALISSPSNCKSPEDIVRWREFDKLAVFNLQTAADINGISKIMLNQANQGYEIFNHNTLQSIIYKPDSSGLYVFTSGQADRHLGDHSVHQAYLDLLPFREKNSSSNNILLNLFIWGIIFSLLGIAVWWIGKHTRK